MSVVSQQADAGAVLADTIVRPFAQALYDAGVILVASAGNNPLIETTQIIPAGFPEVFSIGGTVAEDGISLTGCQFPNSAFTQSIQVQPVSADTAFTSGTDGAFVGGTGVTGSAPAEERLDAILNSSGSCVLFLYGTLSTTWGGGNTRKIPVSTPPPGGCSLCEARGTSFASPLAAGIVARVLQTGAVAGGGDAAFVEDVRTWLRGNADRSQVTDPGDAAPLDHPWGELFPFTYSFDGEREGVLQAP